MRVTKCICGCGRHTTTPVLDGWTETPQRDRGGRIAYTCPACLAHNGFIGDGNPTGKAIGGGIAYRVVLPVTHETPALTAYMLKNDWLRAGGKGYVSSQQRNLNSLKKQFPTLADMRAAGEWNGAPDNECVIVVGPWDGFCPEELAAIEAARGELFNGARVGITPEGVSLYAPFTDAASFMYAMKTAKAMMQYLLAWLEKPTASRAAKVRRYFDVAAYPDGVALPAVGLPA